MTIVSGNERAAQNRVQENELQGGNLDGTEDSSDEQEGKYSNLLV